MVPIDQNTMRFYGRVAMDEAYGGMALADEEGDRLAGLLGNRSVLMMGNHGVLIVGATIASSSGMSFCRPPTKWRIVSLIVCGCFGS